MSRSDIVGKFLEDWPRDRYFWEQLTQTAHDVCKEGLKERKKLKCHITHRTKEQDSLAEKLREQEKRKGSGHYRTREMIETDIFDLAGIRVLLPFPDDVQEVHAFLQQEFGKENVKVRFKGLDEKGLAVERSDNRFLGDRATHFLVTWRQPKGYNCAIRTSQDHVGKTVEVQVTTILMNGWQEAQHDLTYKQLSGPPSEDEVALVEMINGLAHTGEVALRQLRRMQQRRLNEETRPFQDQYELAVWLKAWAKDQYRQCLGEDSALQSDSVTYISLLLQIVQRHQLETPGKLRHALQNDRSQRGLDCGLDLAGFADRHLSDTIIHSLVQRPLSGDISLWAVLKVCLSLYSPTPALKVDAKSETQLRVHVIAGAISLASCSPPIARNAELEWASRRLRNAPSSGDMESMQRALFSMLSHTEGSDRCIEEVNKMWKLFSADSSSTRLWSLLLHASAALLRCKLFLIPATSPEDLSRLQWVWPGVVRSDRQPYLWGVPDMHGNRILTTSTGPKHGAGEMKEYSRNSTKWAVIVKSNLDFIYHGGYIYDKEAGDYWYEL